MQWTVRLEARTSAGEVKTTELVTFSRPGVVSTLAEIGLVLSETKALLARLQASMLRGQVAAYTAHHRACAACGVLQPLKDRRTRRLQTLFGTVEVEAPRFKLCRCRLITPMTEVTVSPVRALLTARCDRVAWIHSRLTKNSEAISMAFCRCRRGVDDKTSQLAGKIADIDTICINLGPKRVFGVA